MPMSGLPSSMMPSLWGGNMPSLSFTSSHADPILEELSQYRRFSRGSNTPRSTAPMRITKPRSANNSPRSSTALQGRRRTIMAETQSRHSLRADPASSSASKSAYMAYHHGSEPQPQAVSDISYPPARPVSWHPSSQLFQSQTHTVPAQQHYYQEAPSMSYVFPSYTEADFLASLYHPPPTPAAYSGFASPASSFSPLSLPHSGLDQQQPQQEAPLSPSDWVAAGQLETLSTTELLGDLQASPAALPSSSECRPRWDHSAASADWSSFVAHGFDRRLVAPPTPPYPAAEHQPEPRLQSEEAIPYVPLEDEESDGEILYGLGLYETPEKPSLDTQADYHQSVISSLLGSSYTPPEPTGKGLKLEDAWEPPADDEDEGEDEDEDGTSEDDD